VTAQPQAAANPWSTARRTVREFVGRRLSPRVAKELLPLVDDEPDRIAAVDCADFATLANHYPELLANEHRKQRGTWYTPAALVEPTVARTLQPLLRRRDLDSLSICDPAAGGGTFLVAALRQLQHAGLPTAQAAACLHGVDIDSTAAALAALVVHEACGAQAPDPLAIAANIRTGDGLRDLSAASFDAVLTNPPWETMQATPQARVRVAALRPHFRCQGAGKLYTYRLFIERSHQLLRDGGRFGLVVPASLWFDRDAAALRQLLLDECTWEWLYGFENRNKLFAIDSRYRFAILVGSKGGSTRSIKAAFARTDPADWAAPRPRHFDYPAHLLAPLSPRHRTFVEAEDPRDLTVLERMAEHGRPLTGDAGVLAWRQGDFNMTSHRHLFTLRSEAESRGFDRGDDAVWRRGDDELLPLYQGAMVFDLHPNTGSHRHGTGHATRWTAPGASDDLRPQYLVSAKAWRRAAATRPPARIVLRALSNATHARTAVACLLPDVPCGNSLGVLTPREDTDRPLLLLAASTAALGSLAFDWALRRRLTGTNLNGFVLSDCVLPRLDDATEVALARLALRLCAVLPWHAQLWQRARDEGWHDGAAAPAITGNERRVLFAQLDVTVGRAFGLDATDVERITTDDGPRGFRRVDRDLEPADRRPQRWLAAARV